MPHRLSAPGVGAYIDADRAVVGTDPALYTARRVRHHLSRREHGVLVNISFENSKKSHIKPVAEKTKRLRAYIDYQ